MDNNNIIFSILNTLPNLASLITFIYSTFFSQFKSNRINKANEEFVKIIIFYIIQDHLLLTNTFQEIMLIIAEKNNLSISDILPARKAVKSAYILALTSSLFSKEDKETVYRVVKNKNFYINETNINYTNPSFSHSLRSSIKPIIQNTCAITLLLVLWVGYNLYFHDNFVNLTILEMLTIFFCSLVLAFIGAVFTEIYILFVQKLKNKFCNHL